ARRTRSAARFSPFEDQRACLQRPAALRAEPAEDAGSQHHGDAVGSEADLAALDPHALRAFDAHQVHRSAQIGICSDVISALITPFTARCPLKNGSSAWAGNAASRRIREESRA